MIKFVRLFLLSTIVSLGFLGFVDAGVVQKIKNARDTAGSYARDFLLQAAITKTYLFNKHVVEADTTNYPELVALVRKVSTKAGINVPTIFVITPKSYSYADKANAWACGDKNRSVVGVGSWILENMTNDELENVLSHEITHIKQDHVFKINMFKLKLMVPALVVSFAALLGAQSKKFKEFFGLKYDEKDEISKHALFVKAISAAAMFVYLPVQRYSRMQEKEADLGVVDLTGNKQHILALEKLENWQKKYVPYSYRLQEAAPWLFSHPSCTQRKKYIQEYTPQPVSVS